MAIVGGANLMFNPDMFLAMSSMTRVLPPEIDQPIIC
jgi:hypothetical protein